MGMPGLDARLCSKLKNLARSADFDQGYGRLARTFGKSEPKATDLAAYCRSYEKMIENLL